MKRFFLIFLALILPLQTIVAAERGFYALEGQSEKVVVQHLLEHADHVSHHHDDGEIHEDDSLASAQHMLDCDQGGSLGFIVPGQSPLALFVPASTRPALAKDVFPSRTTSPPLRPPHAPA